MDPEALGLSLQDITTLRRDEWCARVLAGFYKAALDARDDPQSLFLNYRQLPEAVWGSLAAHFSLSLSREELAGVQEAAKFDAKCPSRTFEPDSDRKQSAASAASCDLAARWLSPFYAELEKRPIHA
jgi:hypothetical protein